MGHVEEHHIQEYLETAKEDLDRLQADLRSEALPNVIAALLEAIEEGRQILIFSGKESGVTALQLARDLNELPSPGPEAIAVVDDRPMLSTGAGDVAREDISSRQLLDSIGKGDLAIGISRRGNCEDVIEALGEARERGAVTIAFLGGDGGKLKGMADHYILYQDTDLGRIEVAHSIVGNIIGGFIKEKLEEGN